MNRFQSHFVLLGEEKEKEKGEGGREGGRMMSGGVFFFSQGQNLAIQPMTSI
jgi:hypothetical protein